METNKENMATSPGSPALVIYQALYDYDAKYEHTLGFQKGSKLLKLNGSNKDQFWVNALSDKGSHGYVPLNYLAEFQLTDQEALEFLGQLLNHFVKLNDLSSEADEIRAYLSVLYNVRAYKASPCANMSVKQTRDSDHIDEVEVKTKSAESDVVCEKEDSVETVTVAEAQINFVKNEVAREEENLADEIEDQADGCAETKLKCDIVISDDKHSDLKESPVNIEGPVDTEIAENVSTKFLTFELVDAVRQSTGISFTQSIKAVAATMKILADRLQTMDTTPSDLLSIADELDCDFHTPVQPEDTIDGKKLLSLFACYEEVVRVLFDDPLFSQDWSTVVDNLSKGLTIIRDADPAISKTIVCNRDYEDLRTLMSLFQAKADYALRDTVRNILSELCKLDTKVGDTMVLSTLPIELLNEVEEHISDIGKMVKPVELLIQLVRTQECLPVALSDRISQSTLIPTLLTVIEDLYAILNGSDPPANVDYVIHTLTSLLMHLHSKYSGNSPVITAFGNAECGKGITQKLVLLYNEPECEDAASAKVEYPALKKLLLDIFSDKKAASMFYETDLRVMTDIALRNTANFEAGDMERTFSLQLINCLLRFTSWPETRYKFPELSLLLKSIRNEENRLGVLPPDAILDHRIVEEIYKEFPELVTSKF